jgi:F-type H+-transporting ATPase subunit b
MGFQFLNTFVCIALVFYFLYKPVKKFMDNRTQKVNSKIKEASDNLASAKKIKSDYEKKMAELDLKCNEILKATHQASVDDRNSIIRDARKEAKKILEDARSMIASEREKMQSEMEKQIINISWIITNDFLKKNLTQEDQNELARMLADKLGEN